MRTIGAGCAFLLLLCPIALFAQPGYSPSDHYIAIDGAPSVGIAVSDRGSALDIGGDLSLSAPIPALHGVGFGLTAGYHSCDQGPRTLPFRETRIGGTISYSLPLLSKLWIDMALGGGLYIALLDVPGSNLDTTSSGFFTMGTGSLLLRLDRLLGISLGVRGYLVPGEYYTVGGLVSARFFIGSRERSLVKGQQRLQQLEGGIREAPDDRVKVDNISLNPIFPVLYSHYQEAPFGSGQVRNNGNREISEVTVDVFIPEFMKSPYRIPVADTLSTGETAPFDFTVLLEDSILTATEAKPVNMDITTYFTREGIRFHTTQTESVFVQRRNALVWDDDRKICAFVTAADPEILEIARRVAGMVNRSKKPSFDRSLLMAMAIHEAVNTAGVEYVPDPFTPYKELSESTTIVDFLQFPRQTLQFTAGDCDDLSILYAALLEAVSVETAFVTIPGHIFPAVACELPPDQVERMLSIRKTNLIMKEGKLWIPIESTLRGSSFLKAWDQGARQWAQYEAAGKAGFIPTRAGWNVYRPADSARIDSRVQPLLIEDVEKRFQRNLERFIQSESEPLIEHCQLLLQHRQNDTRVLTKLGVVYARYGRYEQATAVFKEVLELAKGDDYNAQVNLGNLLFINEEFEQALSHYQQGHEIKRRGAGALLGIARSLYELDDIGGSRAAYKKLTEVNRLLAERFAYLGTEITQTARSAAVSRTTVIWEEDLEL